MADVQRRAAGKEFIKYWTDCGDEKLNCTQNIGQIQGIQATERIFSR